MKKRIRLLFPVMLLCWMAVIFLFSARTADESTEDSYQVGMAVGTIVYSEFDRWDETTQLNFAEKMDILVRKTAHAMEYTVLSVLCTLTLLSYTSVKNQYFLLAWLFSVLYAATDEFHQLFVPGRYGQLKDVLIDSAGALFGVAVAWLVGAVCCRGKSERLL